MNWYSYCLAIGSMVMLSTCGSSNTETTTEPLLRPVRYATIDQAGSLNAYSLSGVAQADQQSNISFRVGGSIRNLNVKLGDRVRRGQLIATLDPVDYSISRDQAAASEQGANANLVSAENQLANARSNYRRIEQLYENNSVPLSDFEQAKLNLESAESNYEAVQSSLISATRQLEAARNQVSYTQLKAPFSGVISAVHVEVNELVNTGTPIVTLSSVENLEVSVGVPENMISQISNGLEVQVDFSVLPGEVFNGSVRELSYIAGTATTYPAIIRLEEDDDRIRPGMAANVRLPNGEVVDQETLICPVQAVGENSDGNFVFILEAQTDGGYRAMRRTVELAGLTEEGFLLKSGLEKGDLVATAGLKSLLDGMPIMLMEE
ncbi:MAG: efflux RND transporter periplasmic adaptor subunit [Bacteroidota bacterium]